jgi:hypothetical protein
LDLTEINRNLAYLPLLSGLENVDPSNWKALSKREPDLPAIYQQVLERGTDEQKNLALELVHPSSKVILQTLLKHCGPDPAEWSDLCWKMLRRLGPALKPLTPKICEALQGTESRTLIINLLKTLRAARGGVHPVLSLLESRYRFHGNQRFWLNQQERMLEDEIAFTGMMALQNADKDGVEALKQLARRSDYRPLANSILDSIEPVHTKEPDTGDARIRLLEKQPTADLIARLRSASRSQKEAISKILRGRDDVPASAVPVLIKSVDRNTVSDVCEIFARMGTRAEGALPFLIAETGKLNSAATYALAAVGPSKKEIVVALTNALGRGSRHAFRALSRCGKNARPALDSMIAYLDSQRYLTPAYMTLMERVATPEDIMRSALKYIPTTIFDNALIIVFRRYRERMRKGAPMLKDQLRNAIKEGAEQEARVCLEALALIKAPGVFELIQEALKVPRTFRAGAYAVIAYGPEAREFLPVILPEMEANPGLINAFRSWGRDACPVLEPFLDSGYRITRSAAHQTLMQIEENRPDKIRL